MFVFVLLLEGFTRPGVKTTTLYHFKNSVVKDDSDKLPIFSRMMRLLCRQTCETLIRLIFVYDVVLYDVSRTY